MSTKITRRIKINNIAKTPRTKTVSYTHLDVYKRQAVGGTIARPNAILSGSVSAFLLTLAVYLVARFNGYPLSGAETIASFIFGWLLGLIYDYLRILLLGKK